MVVNDHVVHLDTKYASFKEAFGVSRVERHRLRDSLRQTAYNIAVQCHPAARAAAEKGERARIA